MTPTMLLTIGLTATFAAIGLVGFVVQTAAVDRRRVTRSLRQTRESALPATEVRAKELASPFSRRVLLPFLDRVSSVTRSFTPVGIVERLDEELVYAGSPVGWDGQRLLALKIAGLVGLVVGGIFVIPLLDLGVVGLIVGLPLLGAVGYYGPEWVLRARSGKRQYYIQRALPDALDLMSITVEAGLGFDAALERVAREMGGPLGEELYRVGQEMRLGKSRSEALRDMSERTTVQDLKSFVLAMVQAEVFGISVSRVLHVQADELRLKRRQRAEEQAQKLPVKIIFPLVLCIFPAILAVLLGPAVIIVYENIITQ